MTVIDWAFEHPYLTTMMWMWVVFWLATGIMVKKG